MTKKLVVVCLVLGSMVIAAVSGAADKPAKVKPALLVIDVQNAYLPYMSEEDKKGAIEGINYVIGMFRDAGFPVVRVYHTDPSEGPAPGSEGFEFAKTVKVLDSDPKIVKNYGNGFRKTDLDALLRGQGSNTLFLTGLSAVACVLATYQGAQDLDYDAFMVRGALISHDATLTRSVQEMTKTISIPALRLVLEMAKAQK
jgi:nicotinamidase-related amidase